MIENLLLIDWDCSQSLGSVCHTLLAANASSPTFPCQPFDQHGPHKIDRGGWVVHDLARQERRDIREKRRVTSLLMEVLLELRSRYGVTF